MESSTTCLVVALLSCVLTGTSAQYQPNWASLDTRPRPVWYDDAKLGYSIYWGVYSVPSIGGVGEWFWADWVNGDPQLVNFMKQNYKPDFTYQDFGAQLTGEFFDPNQWADVLQASGAKYIALTAKHHEAYTLWPSKYSFNWNSMDVGLKRDVVGELASALRNRTTVRFGVYHSLFEWYNKIYLEDKATGYKTQNYVSTHAMPMMYELVNTYKPEFIWSDGDWEATSQYWNSTYFLAWLYNESPVKDTVVVNDRWGKDAWCKHGDVFTCVDRYHPGVLMPYKWECCMSLDKASFGYRRNALLNDYFTIEEYIALFAEIVSTGGNLLMNMMPTKDGRIPPIQEERMRQMGTWLGVNGEAIYGTSPWSYQNDTATSGIWYTSSKSPTGTVVYAVLLKWPGTQLQLAAPTPTSTTTVRMIGSSAPFTWTKRSPSGITINVPAIPQDQMPCQWAWVLKFTGLM